MVGETESLVWDLTSQAGELGLVLLGFDFPIGLPQAYAARAGIDDFLTILPVLGSGQWVNFYQVAVQKGEINLLRPFYPHHPGGTRQKYLIDALGFSNIDELRRVCEIARPDRRAAAPLFWTMGAQQVGKAAISGWRQVLAPALKDTRLKIAIWPFFGKLVDICQPSRLVITETYPAEFYTHLEIKFPQRGSAGKSGKRVQASRAAQSTQLISWAENHQVSLSATLSEQIQDGFGHSRDGEDRFDALVGLFGMLNLVLGSQPIAEPPQDFIRRVEGWILGQPLISV